jgi:hypothetical protein
MSLARQFKGAFDARERDHNTVWLANCPVAAGGPRLSVSNWMLLILTWQIFGKWLFEGRYSKVEKVRMSA